MFNQAAEELRSKANMIQGLGEIYETLVHNCNWECRQWHDADEDHPDSWFTEYEPDEMTDYMKAKYEAYKAVFKAIEKLANNLARRTKPGANPGRGIPQ